MVSWQLEDFRLRKQARVAKVYGEAKREVVEWKDIPVTPRERAWLTSGAREHKLQIKNTTFLMTMNRKVG